MIKLKFPRFLVDRYRKCCALLIKEVLIRKIWQQRQEWMCLQKYARRRKTAAKQIYRTFRAVDQNGFSWTYYQTKNRLHARATVCDNRFFLSYCLRFEKLNVSSKAAIEILEKFFECLETRYSILEPRTSMLDARSSIASSIEDRVSSRDCQLTFARYCSLFIVCLFVFLIRIKQLLIEHFEMNL